METWLIAGIEKGFAFHENLSGKRLFAVTIDRILFAR